MGCFDMKAIGIIPSRYASTRFPGKPLTDLAGKPMVQRVYEQARKSRRLSEVIVATDDERIFSCVESFGGKAVMTADSHQSGTDRCAEVVSKYAGFDVAVNIQGDEPFIDPTQIDILIECFTKPHVQIATLIKQIHTVDELFNTNTPKVVIDHDGRALYFSRQPIPFQRNIPEATWLQSQTYFKHIGIYGYRTDILTALTRLPVSQLEQAESLEQLRWLENGYSIQTAETAFETLAVDTPGDVERVLKAYRGR